MMKTKWALTLHQPWASLIAEGLKQHETRSWAPPPNLIGERLAIHAGKKPIGREGRELLDMLDDEGPTLPLGVVGARNGAVTVQRVGKKRAGRTLDGRTWEEYPA